MKVNKIMIFLEENIYKDKIGIYQIINKTNNKVYIGQTSDRFIERYWHHKWKLNKGTHDNKHLLSSWNKHGEEMFEFSVVHVLKEGEDIDELERLFISSVDSDKLYNIQIGGQDRTMLGVSMSDDTKKKIGAKNKVNMTGRKATEKTKTKMSETRTGVTPWGSCKLSEELARKIKTLLIEGHEALEVSSMLSIDYKIINNMINNDTYKSVKVDGWNSYIKNRKKKYRNVITKEQVDKMNELIKKGYSQTRIAKELEVSRASVKKYSKK